MHPDGFPVPQERDFYWKAAALSFTIPTTILRTVFETEAETLILPLAFDLTEKAQTRILPLVTENCPDYCYYR